MFLYVYILRMNTFILHQVHHTVINIRVTAQVLVDTVVSKVLSNCLIYQQAQLQLEQPYFA